MRVLVVEDEPVLRDGLVDLITGAGHEVEAVGDGLSAVERGGDPALDLVVLDLMLPKLSGIEVCRRLRAKRPALLVLMLTARGSEDDKVKGLGAGADDYLTKPFGARELLARLDALKRRQTAPPPDRFEEAGSLFDLSRLTVTRGERVQPLTPKEVGIIRWLRDHRREAVSRRDLLVHVWGASGDLATRTIDVTIANLRAKIEDDPSRPRLIVAVKGVGYAWGPPDPPS